MNNEKDQNTNNNTDDEQTIGTSKNREPELNPYKVLDLPFDCTKEQIKTKYRQLCPLYHPDKQDTPEKKIEKLTLMVRLNEAYRMLMDNEVKDTSFTQTQQ